MNIVASSVFTQSFSSLFFFLWQGCVLRKKCSRRMHGCAMREPWASDNSISLFYTNYKSCNYRIPGVSSLPTDSANVLLPGPSKSFLHIFDVSQLYCGLKHPVSYSDSNHTRPHLLSSCVFVELSHASLEFLFNSTNYNH